MAADVFRVRFAVVLVVVAVVEVLLGGTPALASTPSICSMKRCCVWVPTSSSRASRVEASSSGMGLSLAETTAQSALREEAQATSYCEETDVVEVAVTRSSPDEGAVDLGTRSSTMARFDERGKGAGEDVWSC